MPLYSLHRRCGSRIAGSLCLATQTACLCGSAPSFFLHLHALSLEIVTIRMPYVSHPCAHQGLQVPLQSSMETAPLIHVERAVSHQHFPSHCGKTHAAHRMQLLADTGQQWTEYQGINPT